MSYGQQNFGGYGQPSGGYNRPPGQYGGPPQYGQPQQGGYNQGPPPPAQYNPPPRQQFGQPYGQQFGQQQGQFGQQPGQYGAPPPSGYQAPPGQYGGFQQGGMGGYQQPPPGVSPDMWHWFQAVDQDKSGKITATELQQALMNGNWSPFNAETCRLMIGMFDRDKSGTIDIHEFAALWKYIQDWKGCFERFDQDRSGTIDANELNTAFTTFGYRLSPQFCQLVIRVFDRKKGGYNIRFDDFIQACVMLKTLTDKFRVKDTHQQGVVRISYEEFLEMVLDNTIVGCNK